MKKIILLLIPILFISAAVFVNAEEEQDPGLKPPIEVAKEYVADKYNCDIDDLTIGDTLIGRGGAQVEVRHGYETEKVCLVRKDFGQDWQVESSEPEHQY